MQAEIVPNPNASEPRSEAVAELLTRLSSQDPVKYLPVPGNAGDSFMNVGFYDLARSIDLRFEVIDRSATISKSDTVVIGGNGNLVPEYTFVAEVLPRLSKSAGTVVMLPSTVREHDLLLAALESNVHLFLREHISFEYCQTVCRGANVLFDHDMAFNADVNSLKQRGIFRGFRPTPKTIALLLALATLRPRALFNRRLDAFRVGKESAVPGRGRLATDVSKLAALGTSTEAESYFAASHFFRAIDRFDEIRTDRLHVAIAATRLGKNTVLYDNSYYKCRAVFEASLSRYPNVRMAP